MNLEFLYITLIDHIFNFMNFFLPYEHSNENPPYSLFLQVNYLIDVFSGEV